MESIQVNNTVVSIHILFQVFGISKSGKEFPVEVVVSSFVIEGEIFYTGIITEVTNREGLTRQLSASSLSSEIEIREKQQKVYYFANNN